MITQAAILFAWIGRARSMEGSPFWFEGHPAAGWATDMPVTEHAFSWAKDGSFGIKGGAQRMYLMEDINAPSWWDANYVLFNLLGKTVTFTADLSGVPCGVAASLYFVAFWKPGPGSNYCDVQPKDGGCFTFDLLEANSHAYEASLHTDLGTRTASDGTCNINGCSVNVGRYPYTASGLRTRDLYGPGAKVIDTTRAFQVRASVSEDGYMSVTLSQEGRSLPHFNRTEAGNVPDIANKDYWKLEKYPKPGGISESEAAKVVEAMKNSVRLVTSLWTWSDISWLDGTGCNGQPPGDIRSAKVSISGLKVEDTTMQMVNSLAPSPPPTPPATTTPPAPAPPAQSTPPAQPAPRTQPWLPPAKLAPLVPPAQPVLPPAQPAPQAQLVLPPVQPSLPAPPVLPPVQSAMPVQKDLLTKALPSVPPAQPAPTVPGQGGFVVGANGFNARFFMMLGTSAALAGFVMLRAVRGQSFRGNFVQQLSRSWRRTMSTSMEDAGELLESAPATTSGNFFSDR